LLVAVQNAEGLIALGMVHFQSFSPRTEHINSVKYSLRLFGDGARHVYFFTHNFDGLIAKATTVHIVQPPPERPVTPNLPENLLYLLQQEMYVS
jgi:hypothetical protein